MARYPVAASGTLDLTFKDVGDLIRARKELQDAETKFYEDRRDLVNTYPGKKKDITASEIEQAYDTLVGKEPWNYLAKFTASGSSLKTGSYVPGSASTYWVANYPGTADNSVEGQYPEIFEGNYFEVDVNGPWRYDRNLGAEWIDLIVSQGGYNTGFMDRGGINTWTRTYLYGGEIQYSEAIGEIPYAYNANGGITSFEAHMLKLVGEAWNAACNTQLQAYKSGVLAYQAAYGAGSAFEYASSAVAGIWNGYTQTGGAAKFNRPGTLSSKLVNMARGLER